MLISALLSDKGSAIISVRADTKILDVTQILREHRIGAVLVMEPNGPIDGVLSERDIVRGLATSGPDILAQPARALMTREVISCAPEQDVQYAMNVMTKNRIRHLPVLRDGRLLGVISIGDLVNSRIREAEKDAEAMREYIAAG